jgi:hypothetical protein
MLEKAGFGVVKFVPEMGRLLYGRALERLRGAMISGVVFAASNA